MRQADALREFARTHTDTAVKQVFHAFADFIEKVSEPTSTLNIALYKQEAKAKQEAATKQAEIPQSVSTEATQNQSATVV